MRWPFMKHREHVEAAKAALARAVKDDQRVDAVADRAQRLRQRNHFAEALRVAMGGKP